MLEFFKRLFGFETHVDDILGDFHAVAKKLDAHAAAKNDQVVEAQARIGAATQSANAIIKNIQDDLKDVVSDHMDTIDDATEQARKAVAVADKIRPIVS